MAPLADWLGITVDETAWPELVKAATFDEMKSRAKWLVPDTEVVTDPVRVFREGRSGAGRDLLTEEDLSLYGKRVGALAPQPFLDWLHREPPADGGGADAFG